jgi:hypothetical protein
MLTYQLDHITPHSPAPAPH